MNHAPKGVLRVPLVPMDSAVWNQLVEDKGRVGFRAGSEPLIAASNQASFCVTLLSAAVNCTGVKRN
jgi:hypothetical protein